MENIFDSLCSALSEESIKALFLAAEGPDLMVLIMKCVTLPAHCIYVDLMCGSEKNCKPALAPSRHWTMPCLALRGRRRARRL
jgi:hypothetical protein